MATVRSQLLYAEGRRRPNTKKECVTVPKSKGRPPSEATLEKKRIEKMLRNMPPHITPLSAKELSSLEESFAHSETIRQEILKTYKHGKTTSDGHAYSMASLGDESLIGHEEKIMADDAEYAERAQDFRAMGAKAMSDKNANRRATIREKNKGLISRIGPGSRYTLHSVAQMIHSQWKSMSAAQKLLGEQGMQCRGDNHAPPSVSTIRRWIGPEG